MCLKPMCCGGCIPLRRLPHGALLIDPANNVLLDSPDATDTQIYDAIGSGTIVPRAFQSSNFSRIGFRVDAPGRVSYQGDGSHDSGATFQTIGGFYQSVRFYKPNEDYDENEPDTGPDSTENPKYVFDDTTYWHAPWHPDLDRLEPLGPPVDPNPWSFFYKFEPHKLCTTTGSVIDFLILLKKYTNRSGGIPTKKQHANVLMNSTVEFQSDVLANDLYASDPANGDITFQSPPWFTRHSQPTTNKTYQLQEGETIFSTLTMNAIDTDIWSEGGILSLLSWDATSETYQSMAETCDGVSQNDIEDTITGLPVGAESTAIAVTPNRLYRIEVEFMLPLMGDQDIPQVVVNGLSTAIKNSEKCDLNGSIIGYYWRAETETLKVGLIGEPGTSGTIMAVRVYEVGSTFRIDYPYRIGTGPGDETNWKFTQTGAVVPISITGGVGPYRFVGTGVQPNGDIVIPANSHGFTTYEVTAFDSNDSVAQSLLFRAYVM